MGKRIYIGVGHGRRPSGTFDPGTIAPDGTREYDVAFDIVTEVVPHLVRQGYDVVTETDHGETLDPNFVGKTSKINRTSPPFDLAMSVHLDWYKAPRGTLPLYYAAGKPWADAVLEAYRSAGLPTRSVMKRTDLHFLNNTAVPALLVEADRVGKDAASSANVTACARAIAVGVVNGFGGTFVDESKQVEDDPVEEDVLAGLSDAEQKWLSGFVREMQRIDGRPTSLVHVLREYRHREGWEQNKEG